MIRVWLEALNHVNIVQIDYAADDEAVMSSSSALLILGTLLLSTNLWAEPASQRRPKPRSRKAHPAKPLVVEHPPRPAPPPPPPSLWTFDLNLTMIGTLSTASVIGGSLNPANDMLALPSRQLSFEVRPDLKARYASDATFVLRPRMTVTQDSTHQSSGTQQRTSNDTYVNEGYVAVSHMSNLQSVTGLQSYQWGAAELASPSNLFFRDLGLDKNYFYETRGQSLVRVNYSPDIGSSFVLIDQPIDNWAKRPVAAGEFHPKSLVKWEKADATQTNYLGLVLSSVKQGAPHYGVYGNWELVTSWTAYADASTQRGSDVYYPTADSSPSFAQTRSNSGRWNSCYLIGSRYVTSHQVDMRLEYLRNEEGWTNAERHQALQIVALDPQPRNVALLQNAGALLPGQSYLYSSVRYAGWGWNDRFTLIWRGIHALGDGSEQLQLNIDGSVYDHIILSGGTSYRIGHEADELVQGVRSTSYGAVAWAW